MADPVSLVLFPALLVGGIIGLIEMFFVHADEIGMGWFMHGLHAFPFTILFTFINMNTMWALSFFGDFSQSFWIVLGVRAVISVIAMLKIAAAAAIAGRVGERFHHTLIIGILIFAVPYVWDFIGPSIPIPNWPL